MNRGLVLCLALCLAFLALISISVREQLNSNRTAQMPTITLRALSGNGNLVATATCNATASYYPATGLLQIIVSVKNEMTARSPMKMTIQAIATAYPKADENWKPVKNNNTFTNLRAQDVSTLTINLQLAPKTDLSNVNVAFKGIAVVDNANPSEFTMAQQEIHCSIRLSHPMSE